MDTMAHLHSKLDALKPMARTDYVTTDAVVRQVRAARALLNWGQHVLAFHAGLTTLTVSNFERRIGTPKFSTEERIKSALERAGIVFLQDDDGGIGVALTNAM
jgi:hypothetical protein